jgi:hypothetical protein
MDETSYGSERPFLILFSQSNTKCIMIGSTYGSCSFMRLSGIHIMSKLQTDLSEKAMNDNCFQPEAYFGS